MEPRSEHRQPTLFDLEQCRLPELVPRRKPGGLRLDGEPDEAFRARVERAGRYARILVAAALRNHCVQRLIADPTVPMTLESQRVSPTVWVDFDQAIAIGDMGSCLSATRNKHWGEGPRILPLEPDDPVDPMFVLYLYKDTSRYNRRFEQRRQMKALLGPHRRLVSQAKGKFTTKEIFLRDITTEEVAAIHNSLGLTPGEFWRAANGLANFGPLPRQRLLYLDGSPANERRG